MAKRLLIHGRNRMVEEAAAALKSAGYNAVTCGMDKQTLSEIKSGLFSAVIIDLGQAPAQGRDLALYLRKTASTRSVPIVFVKGDAEKTARVRELLPDAVFTDGRRLVAAVGNAVANPPSDPVVPQSVFAGYAGKPLCQKLGIRAGSTVCLVAAPEGFEELLGKIPEGVIIRRQARGRCDLVVWFARSAKDLDRRLERLGNLAGRDGLWIAWPKRRSGLETDLTQVVVRKKGLSSGLVDYKICAIDECWSALRFTRKKR